MLVRSYFNFSFGKRSFTHHLFIKYEFVKRKISGRLDTKHCLYYFFKIDNMKPYNFQLQRSSSRIPYFALSFNLLVDVSLQ